MKTLTRHSRERNEQPIWWKGNVMFLGNRNFPKKKYLSHLWKYSDVGNAKQISLKNNWCASVLLSEILNKLIFLTFFIWIELLWIKFWSKKLVYFFSSFRKFTNISFHLSRYLLFCFCVLHWIKSCSRKYQIPNILIQKKEYWYEYRIHFILILFRF